MNLSLAFSTCPNDTFIFEAIVNGRVGDHPFNFDVHLADIQQLNALAIKGEVEIVKISYALYPQISQNYQLLISGGALGWGVGPLVVSKRKIYPDEIKFARIAIPGEHTTANFLFSTAYPEANDKRVYLFSDIEDAVLTNEVDLGVIIHENRFTYQQKGLLKVIDLGEFWEKKTNLPIPLGGIAIKRDLPSEVKGRINSLIRESVTIAMAKPAQTYKYVSGYAQSMNVEVMQKHIDLYVNKYSLDLGETGRQAVTEMFRKQQIKNDAIVLQHISDIFAE